MTSKLVRVEVLELGTDKRLGLYEVLITRSLGNKWSAQTDIKGVNATAETYQDIINAISPMFKDHWKKHGKEIVIEIGNFHS